MIIPRAQLFEFNDRSETPEALRDAIVEALGRAMAWGKMLAPIVPYLRRFLDEAGSHQILDLCAGAGEPACILAGELAKVDGATITLTDLYPRVEAWIAAKARHPGIIDFVPDSVDASRMPSAIATGRVRTVINAFHHFPEPLATAILKDAVESSSGIFVSEPFDRHPRLLLPFLPYGLAALAAGPLLTERDRLAKAFYTWLTPAAIVAGAWDGFVSTLRIYREEDIRRMIAPFGDAFRWEFGSYEYWPGGRGLWFYGVPKNRANGNNGAAR